MLVHRKVEGQGSKDFVGDQVDGFFLAESQAVFELRSSEAVASWIVRVREHERFHWASSVLKCRFKFAQKGG